MKSKRMGLEGYVAHMGNTRNVHISVGEPEGKRQLTIVDGRILK
jgi:hypothetical protein